MPDTPPGRFHRASDEDQAEVFPDSNPSAKNGAVSKREDGIVIIDPVKARGQQEIVDACPYGAISWNEEKQLPSSFSRWWIEANCHHGQIFFLFASIRTPPTFLVKFRISWI